MKLISKIILKTLVSTAIVCSLGQHSFASSPDSIATIEGKAVSEADIKKYIEKNMRNIEQDIYEIKRQGLENYIDVTLLEKEAAARKISVAQLLANEVNSKASTITDEEITAFYEKHKSYFRKKESKQIEFETLETVKPVIKEQLLNIKKREKRSELLESLRTKYKVVVSLNPPRWQVKVAANDPKIGKAGAPIELIEFSSYQCGYCGKARPTIQKVLDTYKDKIHYVFRDYPLGFQPQAKPAAHAAQCAGEQGKYFEYASTIWANQSKLREADAFKNFAETIKLDIAKFEQCMKDGKFYKDIDQDQAEGSEVGVSGTPAFFINGMFLSGAQPYEKFKQLIDDELKRKGL